MSNYIKVVVDKYDEGLMALSSLLPFESFEEADGTMIAYIKEADFSQETKDQFSHYLKMFDANHTEEVIKPQNWNAVWESNFAPVEVDDFCRIRADFHERKEGYTFELTINPKMAFGTGHHETTHMMIQEIETIYFEDKAVFDYGCGTGVLAILADLLGAEKSDALDIETPSYESTIENASLNQALNTNAFLGDLSAIKASNKYDVILANINRNVLLASVDQLYDHLVEGGTILLSGVLEQDFDLVKNAYIAKGFTFNHHRQRGKWMCLNLKK